MRIVHVSDLHFGRHNPAIAAGLADEIAGQSPDLIVASGDFTQIGSAREFELAAAFLDTLPAPVFAVPGNHDVPMVNLYKRFLTPFGRYRRYIAEDLEPVLERDGVVLAGINTARRMRFSLNWGEGAISREQLKRLERRLDTHPSAVPVVVAHHPLLLPEVDVKMKAVKRADLALSIFGNLGVRLVLSGHFHHSYIRRHNSDEIVAGVPPGPRPAAVAGEIVIVQASTAISTRLRRHPNSYNVIDLDAGVVSIAVREWDGRGWRTAEHAGAPA